MNINKDDLPTYALLILLGSGGGTFGGRFLDNDQTILEQKEIAQWKQIEENEDRIHQLEKECP